MQRIDELVQEYNEIEQQQAARLRELFAILKARQGRRYIKFDGALMLDNCWNLPNEQLDRATYLDKYNRQIVEVEAGHE